MCSVLPSPGSSITLRVSYVDVHPEAPLVRLWGLPGERREEYLRLAETIQAKAGPRLAGAPGAGGHADALALGDLCLVELGRRWFRCRVVSRQRGPGQACRVFLLDEGRTVSAGAYYLARGASELFHLPSEVLGCILADLVPPGRTGDAADAVARGLTGFPPLGSGMLRFSWTAGAVEFLGYLHGKEVSGLVREVLIPQCLVVLELPWLLAQMRHLGLAGQVSPSAFYTLLNNSLGGTGVAPLLTEPSFPPPQAPILTSAAQPQLDRSPWEYFYPQLELNVTEPVYVTQISDPYRVYCQLRSLSKEIQILSDAMYQAFEASKGNNLQAFLPSPGSPCAARGMDGCWYRALLLEIYPGSGPEDQPGAVALVICVDYGRKEFVTKRNLRHLPAECFRMPVVTYPCSLHGITDGGCGWTRSQISQLKTLLLGKVVQARIEAYCPLEHLYYVTLYGEDGLNLNCLYGVQAHCLAQGLLHSSQEYTSDLMTELDSVGPPAKKEPGSLLGASSALPAAATPLPVVHLKAGDCHSAQVSFLQDPTEFWVHLQEYRQPLCHLKRNLSDFYSQTKKLEGILLEPNPGSLCCVMLKENSYHRGLVTKVQGKGIEVYLVDRGNTEIVDLYKVKELLLQFRELPAVALRCALANPSPNQSWGPDAVDYFRKTVLNKELVIKVLGMQGDIYIVELFDHSLIGEKNIGKIMSQGKYTEYHEDEVPETLQKMTDETLRKGPEGQSVGQRPVRITSTKDEVDPPRKHDCSTSSMEALTVRHQSSEDFCYLPPKAIEKEDFSTITNSLSCIMQNYSEIKAEICCKGQLEVGNTVDVVVSYTENPSLFWCQLAKSSQDLKVLMAKIQDYCIHSAQPHDWPNPVCLAKFSEDGKWYRALISKVCSTEEVEVAYVDYGNKECVSVKNIRATKAEFLQLKAQAFRCSLYNLIQPKGQNPFVWDEKATEAFQEFVDSATKLELKCTIFALAALNNTDLLNIVDLITPFESVCHFLTRKGLARLIQPQKPLISPAHLLSYYYSTHDIKIGNEEVVYVTHVNDPCLFYCQLARSANILGQLTSNIGKLSKMWHSLRTSQVPGNLYLAKYTDGYWYRAVVTSAKDTKKVFFVDFGNTMFLKDEDLIVVPSDADELLLLPMQAIKCSLSDVADVPKDAAVWFEKAVLDKPLKALIVAKEADGKLIVELYDGKMQINAKLKEGLGLQCRRGMAENEALLSTEANTEKTLPLTGIVNPVPKSKRWCTENLETSGSSKHSAMCREARQLQQKTKREMTRKFPVERFNRSDSDECKKDRDFAPLLKREKMPDTKNGNLTETNRCSSLKKICDLPQKTINPGLKTLVYVSHINNPFDFYVQLVDDEPLLDSISEKLNNSKTIETLNGQQLCIGDLMCAHFSEDGLWYRAVVNEEPSGDLVNVQYIDYGNTAVVNICKTRKLLEDCLSFPVISIHCRLGGVKTTELPEWSQEVVLYFSQRTSEIQMNSEFLEKMDEKWEILLCDKNSDVTVDLAKSYPVYKKILLLETTDKKDSKADLINLCDAVLSVEYSNPPSITDARLFLWKIPEVGQTVKTFSVIVKNPGYFWSQFADTDDIISIERKLQEAGELPGISVDDVTSGYPCLAKYNEDGIFYRAVVSNVEGNTLTVIHIDYGTEALTTTTMIREISDELLSLPPQAFNCCLFGFNSAEGSWTEGINNIFCDMVADSPLEITIMDKQNHGPSEIPLFSVKLECRKISINEKMKLFWRHNAEDKSFTLANTHNLEEQKKDVEKAMLFETETSACSLMSHKDTSALEDLLCSMELQPMDKCLVDARSRVSLETFSLTSSIYQTRHHQTTLEALDIVDQQTMFKTSNHETDHYISEKESDTPNSLDTSEMQVASETEVLRRDTFETQKETEAQAEMLALDSPTVQLPLDAFSALVPCMVPPASDDPEQLLVELDMLRMDSLEEMLKLAITEENPFLRDEPRERSELDLFEVPHVKEELEDSYSLTDAGDSLLLELAVPKVHPLQAGETVEDTLLLEPCTVSPLADNKIQSSFSQTELKQGFPCSDIVEVCGTAQDGKKTNCVEWQTLLGKSYVETQRSHDMCERSKDDNSVREDSLRVAVLDEEQVTDKKESICNLMGFDIGSKCMVWSGVQWYKAQILGVSAEGTKVLNLSNGNEEVANPTDVWNGIPELAFNLTETWNNKMETSHSLPAGDLVVEAEVTGGSDDRIEQLLCCESCSENTPE
ncbi:tudor domain-containing protein 6 [Elgaria multicarinata webbii]|uniref:tudor domain-containing protein 6 n=1 Tax=Elgaria multicarinata webbii TaxID=159646 RepID=UPI002FCD1536